MREGDLLEGELEIGQVSAMLDDLPGAGELVDRIVAYRSFGTAEWPLDFTGCPRAQSRVTFGKQSPEATVPFVLAYNLRPR